MKILAFLQNQWFKDPERVRELYRTCTTEYRLRHIKAALFMGCLTGRRLREHFGEELCDQIIWENASNDICGYASAAPPADKLHMEWALCYHWPQTLLVFGRSAQDAVRRMRYDPYSDIGRIDPLIINCCHPAARGADTIQQLKSAAMLLRNSIAAIPGATA